MVTKHQSGTRFQIQDLSMTTKEPGKSLAPGTTEGGRPGGFLRASSQGSKMVRSRQEKSEVNRRPGKTPESKR